MRCSNAELFKLFGQEKLQEHDEIEFRVKRKLPDCRKIDALSPVEVSAGSAPNRYRRPINRFECARTGCVTSGLLMMEAVDEVATYRAMYDATEFAGGVITLYVYPDSAVTYPITLTFKIGDQQAMTDANVYNITLEQTEVKDDGFIPVFIDLSDTPDSVEGGGWTPASTGAYISLSADQIVGYSSISIFDSVFDFATYSIIKVRCLTSVGDAWTFETVQEQCQAVRYNQNVNTLPFTLTGNQVSANYEDLNPMYGDGDKQVGFEPATIAKVVETYTVGTENYGRIILADANQDECARIALQISGECDVTNASLTALSVPKLIGVDEGHFVTIANADGSTDIIVNEAHVGRELLVSYPKTASVAHNIISTDFLNDAEISGVWTKHYDDGTKKVLVFNNMFMTSFPTNVTSDTSAFSFSFDVARDANGVFADYYTIK